MARKRPILDEQIAENLRQARRDEVKAVICMQAFDFLQQASSCGGG